MVLQFDENEFVCDEDLPFHQPSTDGQIITDKLIPRGILSLDLKFSCTHDQLMRKRRINTS